MTASIHFLRKPTEEGAAKLRELERVYAQAVAAGRGTPEERLAWAASIERVRRDVDELRRAEASVELSILMGQELDAVIASARAVGLLPPEEPRTPMPRPALRLVKDDV